MPLHPIPPIPFPLPLPVPILKLTAIVHVLLNDDITREFRMLPTDGRILKLIFFLFPHLDEQMSGVFEALQEVGLCGLLGLRFGKLVL